MKHYGYSSNFNFEKKKTQGWKSEHKAGGFRCLHCKGFVVINGVMGTVNRNHCNICLWSKHVDEATGDRRATCSGGMRPVGLTFKHEGYNRIGEIMLIHLCSTCQKLSINRIARDDIDDGIQSIFQQSASLSNAIKHRLDRNGIYLLTQVDKDELSIQLFGNWTISKRTTVKPF